MFVSLQNLIKFKFDLAQVLKIFKAAAAENFVRTWSTPSLENYSKRLFLNRRFKL